MAQAGKSSKDWKSFSVVNVSLKHPAVKRLVDEVSLVILAIRRGLTIIGMHVYVYPGLYGKEHVKFWGMTILCK